MFTPSQMSIIRQNNMLKPITAETVVWEKNDLNKRPDTIDYIVKGPYDMDYGRLVIGRVIREKRNGKKVFVAYGEAAENDGKRHVGDYSRLKDAIAALADHAQAFHRPDALEKEFKNKTKGGIPVVFLRRVSSGIVARLPGSTTSWSHDGTITLFSDDPEKADSHMLVRKTTSPSGHAS